MEIYLGARPGRPVLLVTLSACLLAGTLGLAWYQSREARALAPAVPIAHTPLTVRPPKGWVADREQPGTFVLPHRRDSGLPISRRLSISYKRLSTFQPPLEIVQIQSWLEAANVSNPEATRIGALPAVQVRRLVPAQYGRQRYMQETILRVACSPRGDAIWVEYFPLTGLSPSDRELLDDVCATIRIDDPAYDVRPADALAHAGLRFPLEEGWRIVGPDTPEVAGFYLGGIVDGVPLWALGIFRTWLVNARTPADLLRDFAASAWELADEEIHLTERKRADGATVASVRPADVGNVRYTIGSVWVVGRSASEAALLFAYASRRRGGEADTIAARLADQIEFAPTAGLPAIDAAESAGRELAARLKQAGVLPSRWGREPEQRYYLGEGSTGAEAFVVRWAAVDRNPESGYEGGYVDLFENRQRAWVWTLEPEAAGYTLTMEVYRGGPRNVEPVRVHERLRASTDRITRSVMTRNGRQTDSIAISDTFVCPPVESIAEAWAAAAGGGAWIIETSAQLGSGTRTHLLRGLAAGGDGLRRALVQIDYWPVGSVLMFDEQGDLVRQLEPGRRFERVTRRELERRFPNLPELR